MFAPEFRDSKNMHLRNFYVIVPPLVSLASKNLRDVTVSIATVARGPHDGSLIVIITLIFVLHVSRFSIVMKFMKKVRSYVS